MNEIEKRAAEQTEYNESLPDLYQMQLEWQRWRTWFYGEMRHESKRLVQHRRAMDLAPHPESPTYANHERHLTDEMDEQDNAEYLYNEIVVPLDTRIKTARIEKNTEALTAALMETIPVISDMEKFFQNVARPEKQTGGTAPNTSLYLTDDQKQWLRDNGGIQPTIKRLIDEAMKE